MCVFDQNSVVQPKLSSHWRNALCTNWWAPACTNCQLIVASGEGGAAEKLAKPRLVTDVDANCGFLITPPLPTAFSVLQLYVHCTRNELKLRPCIIISTASQCRLPLLQGKAIWRSEPSSYRPMDAIFTGPRCLWGPVCGSRSLYVCLSDSFVKPC